MRKVRDKSRLETVKTRAEGGGRKKGRCEKTKWLRIGTSGGVVVGGGRVRVGGFVTAIGWWGGGEGRWWWGFGPFFSLPSLLLFLTSFPRSLAFFI